jgi:hypothetical protein
VCLPGHLEKPDYFPRVRGQICDFSIDCAVGLICVCIPGATCELDSQGKDGPTCEEICNPDAINECPRQAECTDLGTGRGFCDPTTIPIPG